uniref:Tetratricopeptide repeat domain 5 n=1 Tax=Trypanosoma congolense (strain IL3000) TaxID=1068625 RepID=G0UP60_TRYCI|nr:conserved hypothetical protein [Trypanosoma congolense IL3000]
MTVDVFQLEKELEELSSIKVFDENVRKGVDRILANMPNPDEEHNTEEKVRLYVLSCKALLLLPSFSKDSERYCTAALKLRGDRPDLWVLLSECLEQRNANKEACEALDKALQLDSKNLKALCQYSQIMRILSADPKLPPQERTKCLSKSVERAKEAAAVCPTEAAGWHSYGVALLSEALSSGVNIAAVRRSLMSLAQAARLDPTDPDIRFNKSVIEAMLGNFGVATQDLLVAYKEDPKRLKGTRKRLEQYDSIVRRAVSLSESMQGTGKKTFSTMLSKLSKYKNSMTLKEISEKEPVSSCGLTVGVVDILSEPVMEPMVVLAADKGGEFVLLLLHGLLRDAIKLKDAVITLSVPASKPVKVFHDMPAIPFLDTNAYSCTFTHVIVDINTTIINGAPISPQMRVSPQVSTRLFV